MFEGSGIFAVAKMAHLSHDEAVPKMGHPVLWLDGDLGHPPIRLLTCFESFFSTCMYDITLR